MLRRRPDGTYEFRQVEQWLALGAPQALSPERKDALRLHIMSRLGEQDSDRQLLPPLVRERWIAIPAGLGIAAAVLAANQNLQMRDATEDGTTIAHANGTVLVDGRVTSRIAPGESVRAVTVSWVGVGDEVNVGLDSGAEFRYFEETSVLRIELAAGDVTVVSKRPDVVVQAATFSARMREAASLQVDEVADGRMLTVVEGTVEVRTGGRLEILRAGDRLFIPSEPGGGPNTGGSHDGQGGPAGPQGPGTLPGEDELVHDHGGDADQPRGSSQPGDAEPPVTTPASPNAPGQPPSKNSGNPAGPPLPAPPPAPTATPSPAGDDTPTPAPASPTPPASPMHGNHSEGTPTSTPGGNAPTPTPTPGNGGTNSGGGEGVPGLPGNGEPNSGGGEGVPGLPGNGEPNSGGGKGVPGLPGNGEPNSGGGKGIPGVPGNGGANSGGGKGVPGVPGNGKSA
ncbi:MAG: hypothetical protein M0R74_01790 [Dehalococcoidia bacterium]|nr:hypothetical protein [Dehalococcoidia bacterium]